MLGQKIKNLRIDNNMTQEYLAEVLYVSRQTVCRWESNRIIPNMDNFVALSKCFSIPISYFIEKEDVLSLKKISSNDIHFSPSEILIMVTECNIMKQRIRELSENDSSELAKDNVRKYMVDYSKKLCEQSQMETSKKDSLHSLYSTYIDTYIESDLFKTSQSPKPLDVIEKNINNALLLDLIKFLLVVMIL